jgi:hypothetical protein
MITEADAGPYHKGGMGTLAYVEVLISHLFATEN